MSGNLRAAEFLAGVDATLLDLARFDAYRAAHPDTAITASGYYYPIGANRGYVGLASDPALITAVNKALTELMAEGKIAEFGKQAGLTYLQPRSLRSSGTSG